MMKVLVIGSNGQLGSDVVKVLHEQRIQYFPATRKDVDITNLDNVIRLIEEQEPDAIINCAAFHDLSLCEQSPDLAMAVNSDAVRSLATICEQHHIKFMHISTDYVFDGMKHEGYSEEDPPNPINMYGKSKLIGERAASEVNPATYIVRVQSLYGLTMPSGKQYNFVDLMLKLGKERDELKVDQCLMAPTWTYPLAKNLIELLKTEYYGTYHMSCNEGTTWYEFAKEIMKLSNNPIPVTAVDNDFFPRDFNRPENTYLIKEKLERIGLNIMPSWREALKGYLKQK
jgi:dTDP-4-dehydrorhamnose reductase